MQVVEVLDHHVSRTVDDWTSLNHLKVSQSHKTYQMVPVNIEPSSIWYFISHEESSI